VKDASQVARNIYCAGDRSFPIHPDSGRCWCAWTAALENGSYIWVFFECAKGLEERRPCSDYNLPVGQCEGGKYRGYIAILDLCPPGAWRTEDGCIFFPKYNREDNKSVRRLPNLLKNAKAGSLFTSSLLGILREYRWKARGFENFTPTQVYVACASDHLLINILCCPATPDAKTLLFAAGVSRGTGCDLRPTPEASSKLLTTIK